jgi:hypothetical protein
LPALLETLGSRLTQQPGRIPDAVTTRPSRRSRRSPRVFVERSYAARRRVAEERAHAAFLADVVPANTLAREKYVEPRYPRGAAATAPRAGGDGSPDRERNGEGHRSARG